MYLLHLIIPIYQSTQDLIRRGVAEGVVNYLPESSLQDVATIKSILNDTLVVCIISLNSSKNSD
jgi:hypothetical protein